MAGNALATKAVTTFAVNAAPTIISHVLGGGELSKVTSSICDTIKKVTCKDRIVLEEEIKALAVMDTPTCNTFMNLLYDAVQVYVQSDCKDYSRIVDWLITTPDATPEAKVQFALMLKQQQHDQWVGKVQATTAAAGALILIYAVKETGGMIASQTPKILESKEKSDRRHEETKRLEIQKDAEAKRQQTIFKQDQVRRQTNYNQEKERHKAEEKQRQANYKRDKDRRKEEEKLRQANYKRDKDRRKEEEKKRIANYKREEKRKQDEFKREQKRRQADFVREQERKRAEAEQRARAQQQTQNK